MIILLLVIIFIGAPIIGAFFTGLFTIISLPFAGLFNRRARKVTEQRGHDVFGRPEQPRWHKTKWQTTDGKVHVDKAFGTLKEIQEMADNAPHVKQVFYIK